MILMMATAGAEAAGHAHGVMGRVTLLMIQLAVILLAARAGGSFFRRVLRWPSVLGELASGMIIGPYALGGLSFGSFQLFRVHETMAVSVELYGIATLASIILLFLSGLETDLKTFIRYSLVSTAVGLGGLIVSFLFGCVTAVAMGVTAVWYDPVALFLGAVSAATSVGITARILSDKHKMGSPEGVTILGGAVIDDVLGIITLTVVVGISQLDAGASLEWRPILWIAGKAVGFWLILTATGLIFARRITRLLKAIGSNEGIAVICFGLALLMAGLSEMAGLAMIIGAYITGLALSSTDMVNELQEQIHALYKYFVPVFFCVMGMMVDFSAMHGVIMFGLVYTVTAVLAKLGGCGLPALGFGFNLRGALRVGVGMMPRGEVALIIAGVGLSRGVIGQDIFGVAVLMTIITTVAAPALLVKLFDDKNGVKKEYAKTDDETETIVLDFPSPDVAEFMMGRIRRAFRNEEFLVHRLHEDLSTFQIRKDDIAFTLKQEENQVFFSTLRRDKHIARLILLEEILSIQDLLDALKQMKSIDSMGADLVSGLY